MQTCPHRLSRDSRSGRLQQAGQTRPHGQAFLFSARAVCPHAAVTFSSDICRPRLARKRSRLATASRRACRLGHS